MKKIVVITNKYPNPIEKNVLVFVQQFVWTLADLGIECSVICPLPININPNYLKLPSKTHEKTENGATVDLYFPKYIGFGQRDIFKFNPARITTNNFTRATDNVISKMSVKPDVIYGHFVTPAGIAAARLGEKYDIPSFMAYGESTSRTIKHFGYDKTKQELKNLTGVIAVSSHSKQVICSTHVINEDICGIFPNGYREERFYPRNKIKSREKFGLPQDKFIISFVGSFDHRKGIERLMKAVDSLDDVYVICAGKGELTPDSEKCLYKKPVNHDILPYFYSAADAFVLPTLNEGCCNAIIEAMACGLPIISSDRAFNDDILDETCSIRVDPLNIEEIEDAISCLFKNKTRLENLSNGSLSKAKTLTLEERANNIINFINAKEHSFYKNQRTNL